MAQTDAHTDSILAVSPPFLQGGGDMALAIAAHDWANTALGAIGEWSAELRTACAIALKSSDPTVIWWGPTRAAIYNDGYIDVLGEDKPVLGHPFREVWPDLKDTIGALIEGIFAGGAGVAGFEERIDIIRHGRTEQCYWNYSFTPIVDASGTVLGVLNIAREVTAIVGKRRIDSLLMDLEARLTAASDSGAMIDAALRLIGESIGAKRTGFAEVTGDIFDIRQCWTAGAMPDICGRYPIGIFGAISNELGGGKSVIITDNRTDARTSDAKILARYDQIGLRSGIVVPILDRGRYAGGIFVQDDVPRMWTDQEVALAEAASNRLWQTLVRARAETNLRESEQRFRLIFEQANDIIFTAGIDQRITAANPAGAVALGYPLEDIIGKSISDFVSPLDFAQTTAMLGQKLAEGGHTRHEVGVTGRDGKIMRWENDSTLIVDADRNPIGLLSISRDVTERRAFDERRELLINELNHRVKNTLSLVQGLAHQSFRAGQDKEQASASFLERLSALSVAHDLLTRDQWEGATLAELVRGATAHAGIRVVSSGPHVLISPRSAVALVMALHELTTNAFKYGGLLKPEGRVHVDWEVSGGERFSLVWRETGGPAVAPPNTRGFGIRMIERVLASDLGGTVKVEFAETGLICSIEGSILK